MINSLYLPELREMLAERDESGLREFCSALHPARTAEFMEGLNAAEAWDVLHFAESSTREEIFGFLNHARQIEIIEGSDREEIGQLIADLPPDDRVDLLNDVDPKIVQQLMPLVPVEERRDIQRLGSYAEETAGALMTTEFACLPESLNAREALEELGRQSEELETVYYLYIVDEEKHLRGIVSARDLISNLKNTNLPIGEIMERDLVTVQADDDQEVVANRVARYDLMAIPVLDHEHHLLGIITHDDVIDVVREEATEDAHRISAVEPLDRSYLQTHWLRLTAHRAPWLVILAVGALLTAAALGSHKDTMNSAAWLVFFLPLVISCGGNTGSQSATLIITALTRGDVRLTDWLRVIARELLMGLCLGAVLAAVGYVAAVLFWNIDPRHALIVPITLVLVSISGTLLGSILPLIFRRLGLDPALMSNPLVAGIIDVLGIVIYMRVALAVL